MLGNSLTYSYLIDRTTERLLVQVQTQLDEWRIGLYLCSQLSVLECKDALRSQKTPIYFERVEEPTKIIERPKQCSPECVILLDVELGSEDEREKNVSGGRSSEEFNFLVRKFEKTEVRIIFPGLFFQEVIQQSQKFTYYPHHSVYGDRL